MANYNQEEINTLKLAIHNLKKSNVKNKYKLISAYERRIKELEQ